MSETTNDAAPDQAPIFVGNADRLGHVAPLDGLRGIAMLMVLLAHANYETFASFSASVDMFFVISGFLITTLILEEHAKKGSMDVKEFYLRRAVRLFPMLYLTLAVSMVGALAVGKTSLIKETVNDVLSAGLYVYHVVHPVGKEILTSSFPVHRPLVQIWSLSVEEHFYLVAAIITIVVIKFNLPKLLLALFGGIWLFVAIARATGHVGWDMMWYQRPDSLLVGVMAAYINALMPRTLSDRATRVLVWAATVGAAVIVFTVFIGTKFASPFGLFVQFSPFDHKSSLHDGLYWGKFGFSIVNVCMGLMIIAMVRQREWWLARWTSVKPFRAVGVRSYCIYLIHVPLGVLLLEAWPNKSTAPYVALAYLILLPLLTELSYRYVEQAVLTKRRNRQQAAKAKTSP